MKSTTDTTVLTSAEVLMRYAPNCLSLHIYPTGSGWEAIYVSGDDLRFSGYGKSIESAIQAAANEVRKLEELSQKAAVAR